MNRRYTAEEFRNVATLLRNIYEDVMLTADVIVGFPGETEEEFEITYKFLKEIRFYKIHVFKYSKRNGTKAQEMPNQISPQVQEERSKKIIELSKIIQEEYNKSYIGKTVKVLFEEKDGDYWKGHTDNYLHVYTKSNEDLENNMIDVLIKDIGNESLYGIASNL